ncbi:M23 family metallopeptidase [Actinoplanes sp. CA-252034]|uniref:M23 family metallopeptidase n=1 Tax=Actinoplanes sp. CA-252034 TaxID=3239906 RepID=UPI003D96DF56
MRTLSYRGAAAALALTSLGLLGLTAPAAAEPGTMSEDPAVTAAASRPLFQLPFACGDKWRLGTYPGHDDYDIDMFPIVGEALNRPILASYGGKVVNKGYTNGGGNGVRIDHGNGWQTLYLHMVAPAAVNEGDTVSRGQQIGKVGNTGSSSAAHLHYEQLLNGAKTESYFNGSPSGITDDGTSTSRVVESRNCATVAPRDPVGVYGVLDSGELYYAVVDPTTNKRVHTVTSTDKIGFLPKAIVALNHNTLLATSPAGGLYRIDVITNKASLQFNRTAEALETGWTHELLAFDGAYLYGVADGHLMRYVVSRPKPTDVSIGQRTVFGRGYTLSTLTAIAPKRLLAVSNDGSLLSYYVPKTGDPSRYELKPGRWSSVNQLISGGQGYYLGRADNGGLRPYIDADPYDGNGDDLTYGPWVDERGWTQHLITAVPTYND